MIKARKSYTGKIKAITMHAVSSHIEYNPNLIVFTTRALSGPPKYVIPRIRDYKDRYVELAYYHFKPSVLDKTDCEIRVYPS